MQQLSRHRKRRGLSDPRVKFGRFQELQEVRWRLLACWASETALRTGSMFTTIHSSRYIHCKYITRPRNGSSRFNAWRFPEAFHDRSGAAATSPLYSGRTYLTFDPRNTKHHRYARSRLLRVPRPAKRHNRTGPTSPLSTSLRLFAIKLELH